MESFVKGGIRFYRANRCDNNGNPRVIVHFMDFLTKREQDTWGLDTSSKLWLIAKGRAKACGFRVYRGSDFGGGFVAQGYFPERLAEKIEEVVLEAVRKECE